MGAVRKAGRYVRLVAACGLPQIHLHGLFSGLGWAAPLTNAAGFLCHDLSWFPFVSAESVRFGRA